VTKSCDALASRRGNTLKDLDKIETLLRLIAFSDKRTILDTRLPAFRIIASSFALAGRALRQEQGAHPCNQKHSLLWWSHLASSLARRTRLLPAKTPSGSPDGSDSLYVDYDLAATCYSALKQITTENVSQLAKVIYVTTDSVFKTVRISDFVQGFDSSRLRIVDLELLVAACPAQGLPSDLGRQPSREIREYLCRAVKAVAGLAESGATALFSSSCPI
jgi:hypothetical protein